MVEDTQTNEETVEEVVEETQETPETVESPKEEKKSSKKTKQVVLIPKQTFGFERKSYLVGQKYVMAQKDLPSAVEGKYETQSVEDVKKEEEKLAKVKAKRMPVLGKKK